mgnify:CR=1 FL=1
MVLFDFIQGYFYDVSRASHVSIACRISGITDFESRVTIAYIDRHTTFRGEGKDFFTLQPGELPEDKIPYVGRGNNPVQRNLRNMFEFESHRNARWKVYVENILPLLNSYTPIELNRMLREKIRSNRN